MEESYSFPVSSSFSNPIMQNTNVKTPSSHRTETTSNRMHIRLHLRPRFKPAQEGSIFYVFLSFSLSIQPVNPRFLSKVDKMGFGQSMGWGGIVSCILS